MSNWIPAYQLPDRFGNFLIYDGYEIYIAYFSQDNLWQGQNGPFEDVTHWMELPEPPQDK